jgi:hypothetical protein
MPHSDLSLFMGLPYPGGSWNPGVNVMILEIFFPKNAKKY